ncbi:MAG: conserved rane protein of unknown function [Frankiales bacterium]|nr:conserved rane protein of unknown function [Frankiales bacterium]
MTDVATPPVVAAPAGDDVAARGSLLRAEARRFTSRRFIRVLLLLAAAGYVAAIAIASSTAFAKTTPEGLAAAQRSIEQLVAEQDRYREQCLAQPGRPADVSDDQFCGTPARGSDFRAEDFLDKRPFVLSEGLPAGAIAVGVAVAALSFLIGSTYIGAEWTSRSIVALLFWQPRRVRVIGAKLVVLTAAAVLLAVVAQAVWWATARVMAGALGKAGPLPADFYGDLLGQQSRAVLLAVLAALLGFGISNLVHNTAAALGVGFVYFAVVETAIRNLRPAWQEWLLTDNAAALLTDGGYRLYVYGEGFVDERGTYVDSGRELLLSNLHGGLVLGFVTTLVVGVGVLLFARRDLH